MCAEGLHFSASLVQQNYIHFMRTNSMAVKVPSQQKIGVHDPVLPLSFPQDLFLDSFSCAVRRGVLRGGVRREKESSKTAIDLIRIASWMM